MKLMAVILLFWFKQWPLLVFTLLLCVMLQVWSKLLSPISEFLPRSINLFMAVPTIYAKLIDNYNERMNSGQVSSHSKDYIKAICSSKIRYFDQMLTYSDLCFYLQMKRVLYFLDIKVMDCHASTVKLHSDICKVWLGLWRAFIH